MLPTETTSPKIARKNKTNLLSYYSTFLHSLYMNYFCCIKIHADEQVLFNPILGRPLCVDCYFLITDDERDNICELTDRCTPFSNLSDTNCHACDKPVYFFRQRADNCENCRAFIDFKLSVEDPNSHVVQQSFIESDSESDSEPNEVDYDSEASTIIFEN